MHNSSEIIHVRMYLPLGLILRNHSCGVQAHDDKTVMPNRVAFHRADKQSMLCRRQIRLVGQSVTSFCSLLEKSSLLTW